jgi:hypothetical protein
MSNPAVGPTPPPGTTDCQPHLRKATATEFEMVNPRKQSNFIIGELIGGSVTFIVENLPKDGTGCPGRWLFDYMMSHFGSTVIAIQGTWVGAASDNLAELNRLTAAGVVLEEAAKHTWTGKRATDWLFTQVQVTRAIGSPGIYSQVLVLFTR